MTAHVTLIDYYNTLGITVYTWRPLESYWREGYLPAFISAAQSIKPPKPADYSVDDAKATLKKYAKAYDKSEAAKSDERAAAKDQFDSEKPTVIAIMNETFSDLSIYQNMRAGYEGPQYFKSLSNCLSRGKLYVSAYGGGTANTEFEFMTGNSMANLLGRVPLHHLQHGNDREPGRAIQIARLFHHGHAPQPRDQLEPRERLQGLWL